ncbi:MAG TPA: hypothetical protein ENJ09_06545 [Planctomycetes bacterium]|nr:hypothetical protein [Planctomycetota bacterium]
MNIQSKIQGARALNGLASAQVADLADKAKRATGALPKEELEKNEEAAKAFEGYFNTILVKELRKTLPGGFFSGSGSDVYGSWFDQYVGDTLAERNGLGIGDMIRASLGRRSDPNAVPDFTKGDRSIAGEGSER